MSLSNSAIGKLSDSQTSNASLTMTGTASEAQAWLNSITFTSADVELGNTGASGKLDVTVRDSAGVSTSKSIDVTVTPSGTVAKLAMRQPFVLFKGLTFQKLCLPGAFRPGDHHNKMLRPGLCVVHASPQYL